jgi:hypothetical protein
MAKINFVSVLLFAEMALPEIVESNLKNILQQTFKNREIIVVYNKDRKDLDNLIAQYSVENCRFVEENITPEVLNKLQKELQGDVIFYKTCNYFEWYPRHIQVHVEHYELNKRVNWLQSLIEIRDIANPNTLMNVVGWRLDKPPVQEFEIDEISITKNVNLNWFDLFVENGISKVNFLKTLGNGELTKEISVIKYINSLNNMKNDIAKQLGQPIQPPEALQPNHFPTILGNSVQAENNQKILDEIRKVPSNQIKSIAIKRTLGMGDVLMTEPIRRYLKNLYPFAKITLVCSNSRGIYDLAKYIGYDDIILLPNEMELTQDALMKELKTEELIEKEDGVLEVGEKIIYSYKDHQIKIDLDMAYESRPGLPYVMAYFNSIGVDSEQLKLEDRLYHIYYDKEVGKNPKGIIMYRNGSGWPGRTWEDEKYDWVKNKLTEYGYNITEIKDMLAIEDLFDLIKSNSYYIGPDTGIMHICLCFGLETFVISGASLGEVVAYPYTQLGKVIAIHADEKELPCLGCKHKMFIEILQNQQITFVAPCKNPNGPVCMKGMKPLDIFNVILDNIKKNETISN